MARYVNVLANSIHLRDIISIDSGPDVKVVGIDPVAGRDRYIFRLELPNGEPRLFIYGYTDPVALLFPESDYEEESPEDVLCTIVKKVLGRDPENMDNVLKVISHPAVIDHTRLYLNRKETPY